jgi:glutamate-1-semialdehyde aminotransferase
MDFFLRSLEPSDPKKKLDHNSCKHAKYFKDDPKLFINIGKKCLKEIKKYSPNNCLNRKITRIEKKLEQSQNQHGKHKQFIYIQKFIRVFAGIKDSNVRRDYDIKLEELSKFFNNFLDLMTNIIILYKKEQ